MDRLRPVSDHAVLRYLERHKGVDIEGVRNELRELAKGAVPTKDGEHYWTTTGEILVIGRYGIIVTILSPEDAAKHEGRKLLNGERIPKAE